MIQIPTAAFFIVICLFSFLLGFGAGRATQQHVHLTVIADQQTGKEALKQAESE